MKKSQSQITSNFLDKAFNKMFQAVGFEKWDRAFCDQENWYWQRTWTKDQSNEYKKWFITEIKKDMKLKKQQAEKEWQWFDLMWGWKEQE